MFEAAKQHLETTRPILVIGGWISPSHDDYVGGKVKKYSYLIRIPPHLKIVIFFVYLFYYFADFTRSPIVTALIINIFFFLNK